MQIDGTSSTKFWCQTCIPETMSFHSAMIVNKHRRCGSNVVTSSLSQALQVHHHQLTSVTIQLVPLAVVRTRTNQAPVQVAEVIVKNTKVVLVKDVGKSLMVLHPATCEGLLAWQMMVWVVRHAGVQTRCQQIGWHLLHQLNLGLHQNN